MKHTMKKLIVDITTEMRQVGNYTVKSYGKRDFVVIGSAVYVRRANSISVEIDGEVARNYKLHLSVTAFYALAVKIDDTVERDWVNTLDLSTPQFTDGDDFDTLDLSEV